MYIRSPRGRISQGDIYRDISVVLGAGKLSDPDLAKPYTQPLPYAVVVSQDCDLQKDHEYRLAGAPADDRESMLPTILIVPAYNAQTMLGGEYLPNFVRRKIHKREVEEWAKNNTPRWHFLQGRQDYQIPELVLDFKVYYCIDSTAFYENYASSESHYLGTLDKLYRENVSDRFAFYLARIGLPEPNVSA